MASAADGRVVIDTQLNNKGFTKGIAGLKNQMGGLKSVVGKLGAAIASAFAVRAIINFGKECVELGSNVSEVQNVVDTAFGDMSYKVEAFAETAIQSYGMSRLAAKKTASTYMAMAKGMGLANDAASDMAINMTGLTGDVASFFNISQEAAATKLKSIFTGETESMKDLGVVMTQANLKAYALEQGITKDISAMTQGELVALRYGYVMKTLSLAHGDFARTSDSWANQTRVLSMQWEEFMSIVGQSLITVLTPCVKVLNQIVSSLISVANAVSAFISSIFGKQATQQSNAAAVTEEISSSVEQQEALTAATAGTAKAQSKFLAGFDEINKVSDTSGGGGGGSSAGFDMSGITAAVDGAKELEGSGIASVFGKLEDAIAPFRDTFMKAVSDIKAGASRLRKVFTTIKGDIKKLVDPLKAWASGSLTDLINQFISTFGSTMGGLLDSAGLVFGDIWDLVIYPTIQKWIVDIGPAITEFVTQFISTFGVLFDEIKLIFDRIWSEAIAPALAQIQGIWSDAWTSIVNVWQKYGAPIFDKIRDAIRNTFAVLQNTWETVILPVWDKFMSVVDELWTEHLKPLWDNFLEFVAMLVDGALEIYNEFILPVADWFVNKFGGPISKTVGDIIERIGDFLGRVADVASEIIDILKGVIDFVVGVFTGDWERAFSGIADILKGTVNIMLTFVESFCNFFVRAINKVIGAINSLSFDVPDWVPGIGGDTWGFNVPKVNELKIPRLATGAVIPPNQEFLAVLGDQKHGNNIEAPEGLIRQIVREETGNAASLSVLEAILEAIREGHIITVDKRVLGKVIRETMANAARTSNAVI